MKEDTQDLSIVKIKQTMDLSSHERIYSMGKGSLQEMKQYTQKKANHAFIIA